MTRMPDWRFTVESKWLGWWLEQGYTKKSAAAAFHVSGKTAAKWVRRYRQYARPASWISVQGRIIYPGSPNPLY